MIFVIQLFALATALTGVAIVINPELIFGRLKDSIEHFGLHLAAVIVRLVLGGLLIVTAGDSKFPMIIEVLGWLSIIAATVLAFIGRDRFKALMNWALSLANPMGRFGGIFAFLFGAFLFYAYS